MCDVNLGEICKEGELIFERQGFIYHWIQEKDVGKDKREIFNLWIWWTEPECIYVLENTVQQNAKIKGVDLGLDQSKNSIFNSVKYQVFIIFTMSITNLL